MNPFGVGVAHGKMIWFGEHAVVYHHPAIALPLTDKRVTVKMDPSSKTELISPFFNGPLSMGQGFDGLVALMEALRERLPIGEVTLTLTTDIPVGAGFGASAAIASAIVQAAYDLTDTPLDAGTHFDLIQHSESYFHTNPSGIDAYLSIHNDALRYRKDQSPESLTIDLDAHLVVVYSNVKGSTKTAVESIQTLMTKKSNTRKMADLGHLTLDALEAIKQKDVLGLGQLMTKAHTYLKHFKVSHPVLDELVDQAMHSGALGAKLSGGGLGGIMIALFRSYDESKAFQEALHADGYSHAFIRSLAYDS